MGRWQGGDDMLDAVLGHRDSSQMPEWGLSLPCVSSPNVNDRRAGPGELRQVRFKMVTVWDVQASLGEACCGSGTPSRSLREEGSQSQQVMLLMTETGSLAASASAWL